MKKGAKVTRVHSEHLVKTARKVIKETREKKVPLETKVRSANKEKKVMV